MIVVIDGPAGSGKSSTARAVAGRLEIQFLDSGALYRVATLIYLKAEKNKELFFELLKENKISFHFQDGTFIVYLNDTNVSDEIRTMEVSEHVSEVAAMPEVRSYVNILMHKAVEKNVYVADGRDLGTAVFPDAALKFFMVADLETRAQRRLAELQAKGSTASLEEVMKNIAARDEIDSSRSADPLKQADDAIEIDTSALSFEEQVSIICDQIKPLIAS
ncbi:MAG: (d)CMP kinase [Balneolaceae bacterium]|nr:(d)CMP kinase [Balneolaceae bacterium]MBO6547585.1 (d)CMP kinase [Balneolaceae bacterium]MBO6648096.1 (d)CMP kinase [Balneolaceae bacterium]